MSKEKEQIEEGILYAESLFGYHSRKPIVKISYGITFEVQISPAEAREFAHSILEAAEAAETDAFIVRMLKEKVGLDDQVTVGVLSDFRQFREAERARHEQEGPQ